MELFLRIACRGALEEEGEEVEIEWEEDLMLSTVLLPVSWGEGEMRVVEGEREEETDGFFCFFLFLLVFFSG
jgi:hypothetical protein